MKRNLYLLSLGLVLCSCSEQYDVVTGHARIITKSTPEIEAAPVAIILPIISSEFAPIKIIRKEINANNPCIS